MKRYVVGFVQNEEGSSVLLLRKTRPHFLAGLLNGVGGKIDDGEEPDEAMARECMEECGLLIPASEWLFLGQLGDQKTYEVLVFGAAAPLSLAKALTDEPIEIMPWVSLDDWLSAQRFAPGVAEILKELRPIVD